MIVINLVRYFVSRFLKLGKSALRFFYNTLHNWDRAIGVEFDKKTHDYLVRRTASAYDMVTAPDESYYARHYGDFIEEELVSHGYTSQDKLYDLACGQGRIINELLSRGLNFKSITGVDFSNDALSRARVNLGKFEPDVDIHLETSDIVDYVRLVEDESIDVLLLLEVLYMLPNPELVLSQISRILKSTGIVFFSIRTDHYYALSAVKQGLFNKLKALETETSDELFNSGVVLNWTCSDTIFNELTISYGLIVRECTAIGSCSGIPGDPFASIVRPSELNSEDQKSLFQIEKFLGQKYPNSGRYLLFSATKG